jgi:hypothetical protein
LGEGLRVKFSQKSRFGKAALLDAMGRNGHIANSQVCLLLHEAQGAELQVSKTNQASNAAFVKTEHGTRVPKTRNWQSLISKFEFGTVSGFGSTLL